MNPFEDHLLKYHREPDLYLDLKWFLSFPNDICNLLFGNYIQTNTVLDSIFVTIITSVLMNKTSQTDIFNKRLRCNTPTCIYHIDTSKLKNPDIERSTYCAITKGCYSYHYMMDDYKHYMMDDYKKFNKDLYSKTINIYCHSIGSYLFTNVLIAVFTLESLMQELEYINEQNNRTRC